MPKRWLVASVVAVLLAAAGVVVVVLQDRGVAGVAVAGVDGPPAVGASSTAPNEPVTTSPSEAIGEADTSPSPSVAATTTAPAAGGAPLAGRIKPGVANPGVATFYDSDGGGACLYDPGPDPLTAAMNWADYEDSKACGAYVLVRASNGASLTVRITNLCPQPCRVGQLDLSAEAFARLAAPNLGEIPITWTLVSPELSKRISLRYKTGSSPHWCGIQAIDHRNPVARLEVQAGGQWKQLARTDYNYFLAENGAGCGGAVAITDIYGERLVVDPLPIKPDVVQATGLQFAAR
ncbi:expansin EXLX1 family cellulose-binding protein [Saccharothrix sp. NRRL B-16348]|uniref:expansin EXLX1 family cellulose-binding protein n=1 Tax=Saccharothrix sp. NRRL B-16348 TaxID=1415542 RepID=UPI0006AE83F8|nr:expansin EXLX1 family cellulose-binding protein [Saccharothrix sp. NRRL B-16348]